MKSFALVFCYSLFAAACAAPYESRKVSNGTEATEQDEFLRDALTTICRAVESWVENNTALEPMEFQRHLEKLVDDTLEQNKAFAAIGNEDEEDDDSVIEYGLGKKLKKWRKKAKKALIDAAKAVAIQKAVGAAAAAVG
uniref:Putative conserved secreted protein n=1 Tax=Rhipicephalus microplus TaxID=6941 RepID=A0A6M2CGR3_RHIMP